VPPPEGAARGPLGPSCYATGQRLCVYNFFQFLFLSHNFGSRYARKPIKGSKDSDDSLDSINTLSQKVGQLGCHQCQVTSAIKSWRHANIMTSPPENSKPKTNFFKIWTTILAESVGCLNSSLAQSAGKLWSCKSCKLGSKQWPERDLKAI